MPFLTPEYSELTLVDRDKLIEVVKTLSVVADTCAYDQILFMYDCDQFADETNFVLQVQKTIENYNESEDKGKYILKVVDDPSSIIGKITNTTNISMDSVLSLF